MLEATQMGRAMVQQTLAAGMPWGDKSLNEYVNRLGQNLARSSGSQQLFSFYVLYDPRINARSFPGGYIVVNSGVISLAESEAELASVLSHEIAHENSCDWRTAPWKGNLFELIVLVPAVVLAGPVGIALASGSGWAATVARARSSRSEEQRADRLAAQYLARAGYDPHAAAKFFQRVQAEQERSGGESGGILATHPRSIDRQRKLERIIPHLPPPEFELHDEAEFVRMRRAVQDYDTIYSRAVAVRAPGHDAPPPELSRRPAAEAEGSRQ
jgi:predicted Zn-dependent protease